MNKLKAGKLRSITNDFKKDGITTDGSILLCDLCHILITVTTHIKKHG